MKKTTISILNKFIASLSFILTLGCSFKEPFGVGCFESFCAIYCDTLTARNAKATYMPSSKIFDYLESNATIASSDYILTLFLHQTNYDIICPHDLNMVEQMKDYYSSNYNNHCNNTGSTPVFIYYCIEEIENINITASNRIFETAPGDSLNDKFEVYHADPPFFFDNSKHLVTKDTWGSINDYLALRPIASPVLYLRMLQTPPEAPCGITFNVEVKIKDKDPFFAATKQIILE